MDTVKQLLCKHVWTKRFAYVNTPHKQKFQECLKCGKIVVEKRKQK